MSVSSTNLDITTLDEMEKLIIEQHLPLMTISNCETTLKSFMKQVEDMKFIHDTRSNANTTTSKQSASNNLGEQLDDLGIRVTIFFNDILFSYPPILKLMILNNTNTQLLLQKCLDRRFRLDDERIKLQALTQTRLQEPNKNIFDIRARQAIVKYEDDLIEEFQQSLTPTDRNNLSSTQVDELQVKYVDDKLSKFTKRKVLEFDTQFADAYDSYQQNLELQNNSTHQLSKITQAHDRECILESTINTYGRILKLIVTNIKNIIKTNEDLVNTVKSPCVLLTTGEEIVDPYSSNNIAGIYQILTQKFKKRTFVTLCNALVQILSWQQTDDDALYPERALIKMNTLLANWTLQNLYPMMTKDIFFSANLIKGLSPKCPYKDDIIREVQRYIREMETDDTKSFLLLSPNSSNMPIYLKITELIEMQVESRNISTIQTTNKSNNSTANQTNFNNNNNRSTRYGNNHNVFPKIENAHASQVPRQVLEDFTKKMYKNEISISNNIFIKLKNKHGITIEKPYCALKTQTQICDKCFPADSSAPTAACSPPCFGVLCSRCHFYGHFNSFCLHTHDSSGKHIPIVTIK